LKLKAETSAEVARVPFVENKEGMEFISISLYLFVVTILAFDNRLSFRFLVTLDKAVETPVETSANAVVDSTVSAVVQSVVETVVAGVDSGLVLQPVGEGEICLLSVSPLCLVWP